MSEVLRRGDRRRAAVDQLQDRIGALDAEIGRVAGADFPATDVYGRARMAVETFLARHSPAYQLSSLRKPGSPRLLDVDARAEDVLALALYLVGVDRAAELLAEGAMRERFEAGLPAAERAQRVAELERERDALAIAEEAECAKLEAADDVLVLRREGVDARLVLQAWRTL